jgi:hypothetical protein
MNWHTAWQGNDIVVYSNDIEVDRFAADRIERVIFVHKGSGSSPGDLIYAVVELPDSHLILPADTGFAGRVHFERLNFWAMKDCVYWAREQKDSMLPVRSRRGIWLLRPAAPEYSRVARPELDARLAQWNLVGPQTWEQRKWERITANRPFAATTMPADMMAMAVRLRA